MIYLDTHVAVWLYDAGLDRFPGYAKQLLEENDLRLSPMAVLELQYLHEIKRITIEAPSIVEYLEAAINLQICPLPFHRVVIEALDINWTRDPFDRLIVAQTRAGQGRLLTKDQTIHNHTDLAVWT